MVIRNLPRFVRQRLRQEAEQPMPTEEVVALIDRAFTAGYAAGQSHKYLRPAKRRFLENLAEELRQ